MVAFICAVAMAFANIDLKPEISLDTVEAYDSAFVRIDDTWHPVEVDCEEGDAQCEVIFSDDPSLTPYPVYNTQNLNDPAKGSSTAKFIDGPVPSND